MRKSFLNEITLKILVVFLFLQGCQRNETFQGENYLVILNTLSETLSYYDLDKDTLYEDVLETGRTPNYLLIQGDLGIVVNSGFQGVPSLDLINLEEKKVISRKPLPVGTNPYGITYSGGKYYLTLSASDMVYVLTQNLNVTDSFKVGKWPQGITSFNGKVYISATGLNISDYTYEDGYLYIIDPQSRSIDSIKVGKNPQTVKVKDNKIWVMCTGDYWSVTGAFYKIDQTNLNIEDSINVLHFPNDFEILPDGQILYTDFMSGIFKTKNNGEIDTIYITTGASNIILDGDLAFVSIFSSQESNYILLVDYKENRILKVKNVGQAKGVGPLGIYRK